MRPCLLSLSEVVFVLTQDCWFSLTGVVATQTLYYFQGYPDDKPLIKLTVSKRLLTSSSINLSRDRWLLSGEFLRMNV